MFPALLAAFGNIYSGIAGYQAGEYSASVDQTNAALAEQQGALMAGQIRRQGAKALGAMRAGYTASGVNLTGSVADVMADSARNVELDALTAKYNADVKAYGYNANANLDKMRARSSLISGVVGAGSSILLSK